MFNKTLFNARLWVTTGARRPFGIRNAELKQKMAPLAHAFLEGYQLRPIAPLSGCPFTILGLAVGKSATPLEALAAESSVEPNLTQVRSVWKTRQGGRAAPLILEVLHNGKATLCGPLGDEPATYSGDPSPELSAHGAEKTDEIGRPCRPNLASN